MAEQIDVSKKESEPKITDAQIKKQAEMYLDHWMGGPRDPHPFPKGYMVEAFKNFGNEKEQVTPEDLSEWLPGYTRDDMRKLAEAILEEAKQRDEKEGSDRWEFLVSK